MKKIFIILITFVIAILAFYFAIISPSEKKVGQPLTKNEPPLDSLVVINMPTEDLYVVISQEAIHFEPFEHVASHYASFSIKKSDYPRLFEQGVAKASFIGIERYTKEQGQDSLILVTNNQPDHGGYAIVYGILVDPLTGKILKENITTK